MTGCLDLILVGVLGLALGLNIGFHSGALANRRLMRALIDQNNALMKRFVDNKRDE